MMVEATLGNISATKEKMMKTELGKRERKNSEIETKYQ